MQGALRFSTSMVDGRPKVDKDPAAAEDEGTRVSGGGFYDDSDAKLANKHEDRRLAAAIQGISLERCRTVAEIEHGKKTVKKGFQSLLSQQQLLDVARADNVIGARRRTPGDTPPTSRLPSPRIPRRPQSSKNVHSSSSVRQHLYVCPASPNISVKSPDINRTGRTAGQQHQGLPPHTQDSATRISYEGFRGSRPLTSGIRKVTGALNRDSDRRSTQATPKPNKQKPYNSRARTAPGFRQKLQNQLKQPIQTALKTSHSKPDLSSHNQHVPIQTGSARHSVETDDTDTDDDLTKRPQRQRSRSAFGIEQIHLSSSSSDEEGDPEAITDPAPTPRQRSNSNHGRPQTAGAATSHCRSRRELSRLTHIDAITAAEMALRRKMWLAHKESKNHLGDAALQQRVQEFITKLDGDKRKTTQPVMLFESKDKPSEERLVLPAV